MYGGIGIYLIFMLLTDTSKVKKTKYHVLFVVRTLYMYIL